MWNLEPPRPRPARRAAGGGAVLVTALLAGLLAGPTVGCKEDVGETPDLQLDGGRRPGRDCPKIDDHSEPATAVPLSLGERFATETWICPPTDVDWFRFSVPPGQPLVTIQVGFPLGATSAVELAYDVFAESDTTMPITGARDDRPGDNRSALERTHSLDPAGGTYLLQVRDVGNDEQDAINTYGVTITTAADPDPAEPNNTCATATPYTGAASGAIGAAGDRDAFTVEIPAGVQILEARLTTAGADVVDPKVSLFAPDGRFLNSAEDPFGDDGPSEVVLRHGLVSSGGRYCVIVEDDDGQDASTTGRYTLNLRVVAEPDEGEGATRNDRPADAIDLGGGGSRTGIIASRADLDWYRISARPGQILAIELECPSCTIQPALNLMYGHETSPCGDGDACDFLLENNRCQTDSECRAGVCRDTPMGRRCGLSCSDNLACPGFACQQTGRIDACVAVGSCTPEGRCGAQQYTAVAEGGVLRTAQPAQAPVSYLLVHDLGDDAFDAARYTLRVSVVDDPDPAEPNNFYVPYTNVDANDVLARSRPRATPVAWTRTGDVPARAMATGRGCIGYAGDIDVFVLQGGNPCAIATSSTGMPGPGTGHCGLSIRYDRPSRELELSYFLQNARGRTRASFSAAAEGAETVFGDAICGGSDRECMFFYEGDQGDYFLIVRDFGQDDWSTSAGDCYTWTLFSEPDFGCPASCPTPHPNDGLCDCMP